MKKHAPKKSQQFLRMPRYAGGKKAFSAFIEAHLKYPATALEHQIAGEVHLAFDVDDNGNVKNARITKGLGYGCDEEALRLINLIKYSKVKNRGRRLTIHRKGIIRFKLPQAVSTRVVYSVHTPPRQPATTAPTASPKTPVYNYTIKYSPGEKK